MINKPNYAEYQQRIENVKLLRKETGRGLVDCKRALERCNWKYEPAKLYLMQQGPCMGWK